MTKYRIIKDEYLGYEVQKLIFIFWFSCGVGNTFSTIAKAKKYLDRQKNGPEVLYEDED